MKTKKRLKAQLEALKPSLKEKFEVETKVFLVLFSVANKLRKVTWTF